MKKRIGFLINPVAGIGGQAGMKGSDDRGKQGGRAAARGYQKTAARRAGQCLRGFCKGDTSRTGQNAGRYISGAGRGDGRRGFLKEAAIPYSDSRGRACPGGGHCQGRYASGFCGKL